MCSMEERLSAQWQRLTSLTMIVRGELVCYLAGMEMRGPGAKSAPRAFELDGILLHFLARI